MKARRSLPGGGGPKAIGYGAVAWIGMDGWSRVRRIGPFFFWQNYRFDLVVDWPIPHLAPNIGWTKTAMAEDTF